MNPKTTATDDDIQLNVSPLLVPSIIPENERWLYDNPQTLRNLETALAWSQAHPADDSTTEAILKKLAE